METVEKLLNRFVEYGKILYDAETKELYIINWLHYNPILNTNVEKCVLRELKTVKIKNSYICFTYMSGKRMEDSIVIAVFWYARRRGY